MKVASNIYLTIYGIKFTVKKKYQNWHLAFSRNGKRINRSTGLEATKENLLIVKREVLPQIAQELVSAVQTASGAINSADATNLEDFTEKHFLLHKENVRAHVHKRDVANFQRHILPYFKGRKLSSIKPMELDAWQNRLLQEYNSLSVQKYRSIFYGIFERAKQNDLITKNPFDSVTAPKLKKKFNGSSKDEVINPFTQKEIDKLVKAKDDTYMPNFIQLMASTGMRPGEMIALTWEDIDFDNRSINVNKTIVNGKKGLPKTLSSVRVIDMLQDAYEALKAQHRLTGTKEYVFVNSNGDRFYSHDIINLNFKKRLIANNIEVRPLYQLRHSFASRMIKNGIDIPWVSAMLGHKDSSITLQVYTKFIQEDKETRMNNIHKINNLLNKEK